MLRDTVPFPQRAAVISQSTSPALAGALGQASELMNALQEFYDEMYDDAFLNEVRQKEEEILSPFRSPLRLSSSSSSQPEHSVKGSRSEGSNKREKRAFEWTQSQTRDGPVYKKLKFQPFERTGVSRSVQLTDWYEDLISRGHPCYVTRPSLEVLEAHGELSKMKALLILTHFPKGGWEVALTLDELKRYKNCNLEEVNGRVHHFAQLYYKSSSSKMRKINWSAPKNNHLVFHCEVSSEGQLVFKGPFCEQSGSPLQRVFGDAGVLRVHFAELKNDDEGKGLYRKIAREGFWVGLRHYTFFAFKDPKAKKKQGLLEDASSLPKCFFVCTDSFAKDDINDPTFRQFGTNSEAHRYMMHIENVPTLSKRFSRLQLALSQTLPILDLSDPKIKVQVIEDIYCRDSNGNVVKDADGEPLIHTDGTGFVSKDIADCCPVTVLKGKTAEFKDQDFPLLLQVRVFYKGMVAKGTLLVNLKLPPSTIVLRNSMVKVKSSVDEAMNQQYNSLELCTTSRKPAKTKTFQQLTLLLSYGGVPESVFMKLLEDEVEEIMTRFKHRTAALSALKNLDQHDVYESAIRMLAADIPLEEPYLQKTLWNVAKSQLLDLSKARITIPDTYYLMGCADPTGKLERHQVAFCLDDGPMRRPKVIIYKPPGLHVGDVKVFEATWYAEFEEYLGPGAKYVVFFSTKGPRAVVDEIANSDLDGDQYWICANPLVVEHFTPSEVWESPGSKKNMHPKNECRGGLDDFNRLHFEAYLKARFKPSATMGSAANNWLAHMDKYLSLDNTSIADKRELWTRILSLVNTYYEAVDAEKTGNQVNVRAQDKAKYRPHYMENDQQERERWIKHKQDVYISKSILGKIFDFIKGRCETNDFISTLDKIMLEDRFIDSRFEYPGYEEYYSVWDAHFKEYRKQIAHCLQDESEGRNSRIDALIQGYRQELYKADTLIGSQEPLDKVYKQASAIYIIVYNAAKTKLDPIRREGLQYNSIPLQFAWKVAGYALIRMYTAQSGTRRKEPILFDESVFRDIKILKRTRQDTD